MNYTYILRCCDGTLYTGWSNDIEARIRCHNSGKGGRYTRSRLPVSLVYAEEHETQHDAMHREWEIKRLSRAQKLRLIEEYEKADP